MTFVDDLNFSNDLSDEPVWEKFYRQVWPDLIACTRLGGPSQWQHWGIDREVTLKEGKRFAIDEKKRRTDYGDIALEFWSVYYRNGDRRNKVGWACDASKLCNFVAYAVVPAQRCYLLPTELVRLALKARGRDWLKSPRCRVFDTDRTRNNGYVTRNIAVPWEYLSTAMTEAMTRDFVSGLSLPKKITRADQLSFTWSNESEAV